MNLGGWCFKCVCMCVYVLVYRGDVGVVDCVCGCVWVCVRVCVHACVCFVCTQEPSSYNRSMLCPKLTKLRLTRATYVTVKQEI